MNFVIDIYIFSLHWLLVALISNNKLILVVDFPLHEHMSIFPVRLELETFVQNSKFSFSR